MVGVCHYIRKNLFAYRLDESNISRILFAITNSVNNILVIERGESSSKGADAPYLDFKLSAGQTWTCPWSCPSCSGVLVDPITLPCGHTYCKRCLLRIANANPTTKSAACSKCGSTWFPLISKPEHDTSELADHHSFDSIPSTPAEVVDMLKVNVLVSRLCTKYWKDDVEAAKLRLEANNNFGRGMLDNAVEMYSAAIQIGT